MDVFASPDFDHHEQVLFCHDRASGLRAIVAIHDTTLGPAVGGCRMWPYGSEAEALTDALRLSRGMTYKAAMAGLEHGGGKTVVIGDPRTGKSEALFRALGRAIDALHGRYHTAEDAGTSVEDMDLIARATPYVLGRTRGGSGDPSPMTAEGVLLGIEAALRHALGQSRLTGARVALQGLGHVGMALARRLAAKGARLIVADIDPARCELAAAELGAVAVAPDSIYACAAEVFAPCALGGILNDDTIPRLACKIVAGSANNQLLEDRHGAMLLGRGILYAPDYVINAGGLINVTEELHPDGYARERALARIRRIPHILERVFATAQGEGRPTNRVADDLARAILQGARRAA